MNIELSVKEENGVVKITITSADKPVVMETGRNTVSALSEKITSLNREYERIRKAVYRAKKKLAELVVPQVPVACPRTVPNSVPGDKMGQGTEGIAYNTTCNTNTKLKTISTMSDRTMSHTTPATTNTRSPEPMNNCLPFVPEETRRFIPLANLPEVYQNLLQAWNDLPLPEKLKGLYPDVAQKLHNLLKEFGEAAVKKAIHMVTDSPFLLGKITNTRGWKHIYFGWLLKPGNLQKILDNKYRNREQEWGQNYYGAACPEYTPWTDTESCYLDPGFMTEGLTPLNEHTRNCLEQAAKLLGLKKEDAA